MTPLSSFTIRYPERWWTEEGRGNGTRSIGLVGGPSLDGPSESRGFETRTTREMTLSKSSRDLMRRGSLLVVLGVGEPYNDNYRNPGVDTGVTLSTFYLHGLRKNWFYD